MLAEMRQMAARFPRIFMDMNATLDIQEKSARQLVAVLEGENDIVRIVDPVSRKVLYWPAADRGDVDCPCMECNAVWGRAERCPNCSSLEALKLSQRTFKMELNHNRAFWVTSRPLNLEGKPCVLETVNDVTEGLLVEGGDHDSVISLISSLNHLVMTDALTSLYNRRFLDEFAHRLPELQRAGKSVTVAMIDLDGMKHINDTYGHPAGDAVLKDVAGFLKLNYSVRDGRRERYAVRYGGDEFLLVDVGSDPAAFESDVRDRYASMRLTCYFGEISFPFSLSCGFASTDDCGYDWDVLVTVADRLMYAHKRSRR